MIRYRVYYGHDLSKLMSDMIKFINSNNYNLLNYSICKEGLIFHIAYTYKE